MTADQPRPGASEALPLDERVIVIGAGTDAVAEVDDETAFASAPAPSGCCAPPAAARRCCADVPVDTAPALERRSFERLFDSEDQKEGMRAFLEKRSPRYEER